MNTIAILQIIVSVALIVLILLQQRESGMAGFLGGGGGGSGFYQQRRGLERLFFVLTIILVVVFAGLALTSLFYTPAYTAPLDNASSTPSSLDLPSSDLSATSSATLP